MNTKWDKAERALAFPDWCDATRSLLDAPTGDRIEEHGTELLSRALNVGRVIAFVGAGASMAYGRISWRDLVSEMWKRAEDEYRNYSTSNTFSITSSVETLSALLGEQKITATSRPEDFLTIFQLSEQLFRAVNSLSARSKTPSRAASETIDGQRTAGAHPDKDATFRQIVRRLMVDDRGHMELMLDRLPQGDHKLFKAPPGIDPDLRKVQSGQDVPMDDIRRTRFLERLLRVLEKRQSGTRNPEIEAFSQLLRKFMGTGKQKGPVGQDTFIRPYHRFLIQATLSLIHPDKRVNAVGDSSWHPQEPPRGSLIPYERDPLTLTRRLEVLRFLTTNYDSEIEKLMDWEGFQHVSTGQDDPRKDLLGRPWRDVVFDKEKIGHLLAFAARDGRRAANVTHLHGRASDPDLPLIVTEADYQERYLSENDLRSGMEDAMNATFGGNPLLFLGSGIGEDDLLRPLRQFVGDKTPMGSRLSVALLPSDRGKEDRTREKIRNLQRFGVYTIHYGSAEYAGVSQKDALHNIVKVRDALRTTLSTLDAILKGKLKDAESEDAETIRKKLGAALDALKAATKEDQPFQVPDVIETMAVSDHPGLSLKIELDLLRRASGFARQAAKDVGTLLKPAGPGDLPGSKELGRLVAAYGAVLSGAMDSVFGAFLCARLLRIRPDWERWRAGWLQLPKPQEAELHITAWRQQAEEKQGTKKPELLYLRHAISLRNAKSLRDRLPRGKQGQAQTRERFYAGAPSQTYNALLDSMEGEKRMQQPPAGRRIFLLVASRGTGKGHFFSALSVDERLKDFREAAGGSSTDWAASMFFNLTLTHEVASPFDELVEVLLQVGDRVFGAEAFEPTRQRAKNLAKDRVGCMAYVLREYGRLCRDGQSRTGGGRRRRVIVAFNGISMLFDREGRPKNAQIGRLFDLLVGAAAEDVPMDLVLVTGESSLPCQFRRRPPDATPDAQDPTGTVKLTELRRSAAGERTTIILEKRASRLNIQPADDPYRSRAYVHFLFGARAVILAAGFFPSVALAVALAQLDRERTSSRRPVRHTVFHPDYARKLRFGVSALARRTNHPAEGLSPKELFPDLLAAAALRVNAGKGWLGLLPAPRRERTPEEAAEKTRHIVDKILDGTDEVDKARNRKLSRDIDKYFLDLFRACGEGRFSLTLILATAYQFLLPVAERPGESDAEVIRCLHRCTTFLTQMRLWLEGMAPGRREDLIISRALEVHAEHHAKPNWPLSAGLRGLLKQGMGLWHLQRALLWHLAVIGQPVVASVLAKAPLVIDAVRSAAKTPPTGARAADQRLAIVKDVLTLLEQRCLVFRVRQRDLRVPGAGDPRYALHSLVQRHVFTRLHAPFVEYAEADQFSITLYASQPNDVPRLSPEAHKDLHRTVAALIGHPEAAEADLVASEWLEPKDPPESFDRCREIATRRAQMLRAAFGIVRSVYSVSNIARFEQDHGPGTPQGAEMSAVHRGFFEEHRLLVRWMLLQATKIDDLLNYAEEMFEKKREDGVQPGTTTPLATSRPFYAEEIVWLYNECATLSFVQGRMPDALGLFDRADAAAAHYLEPANTGALRLRIALNRVHADIERGRLGLAEAALERILSVPDEHPVLHCIAQGLLGLINHLRGRFTTAQQHYQQSLDGKDGAKGLIALNRSRAAALIIKSLGDLHRTLHEPKEARSGLRQAATLALEGGHEDMRHHVLLSELRLDFVEAKDGGKPLNGSEMHQRLDVVEEFARTMGMPRLQCEVDQFRTVLHKHGGDLKAAATVASRGLASAAVNDMRLRKTMLMVHLAEIYADRKLFGQCQPLLLEAMAMARDTDYFLAVGQGEHLHAQVMRQTGEG